MKYGIGIRYSENGVRLLKLSQGEKGLKISGIAAGPPQETIKSFFESEDIVHEDTAIAAGLGPGDYISSFVFSEEEMSGKDMETHLKWEIEQKIISEPDNFTYDFFITNSIGCVFAGLNEVIAKGKSLFSELGISGMKIITDVESVALFNGSEGAGEIGMDAVMLISVEAEGISSLVLENGALWALESVPVVEESLSTVLPGLDSDGLNDLDGEIMERMVSYITDSMSRLTSFGENKDKPTPQKIVLSGGGIYIGNENLAEIITERTEVPAVISNPLKPLLIEVPENQKELVSYSAAFTTCFGLAIRALED